MNLHHRFARLAVALALCQLAGSPVFAGPPARVPVLYTTDLLHPHDDPDDHFDLATLMALPELDVRCVVLDLGERQKDRSGKLPMEQMNRLTGRRIPSAPGISRSLRSCSDTVRDVSADDQRGIELLLASLRASRQQVIIITAGSLRDVAAALNREPALFREKVRALYVNAGNAASRDVEWNVRLDPKAFAAVVRSGLPIFWCPCIPFDNEFSTYWKFKQAEILATAPAPLQNFFIYALQRPAPAELDPMAALTADLRAWHRLVWEMPRNMWCTPTFLHAAGRAMQSCEFIDAHVEVDDQGFARMDRTSPPNMKVFHVRDAANYPVEMREALGKLFRAFPLAASMPASQP